MYIVRADGNAKIGAGHLMRCLTIIEELVRLTGDKEEVLFLCADEASAALAQEKGFRATSLGTDYRDMESELPVWESIWKKLGKCSDAKAIGADTKCSIEAECTIEPECSIENCTILVDSYHVTEKYLQGLKQYGKIILLDDMQQKAFPADVVVNYNVFAKELRYKELYQGRDVKFCVGGNYVPVRSQFLQVEYRVSDMVADVLITTGGGDADNIAGAILQRIYNEKLNFHLITGKFNPHLEKLKKIAGQHGNVHIYHDVKDMAGLMRKCDIAVTAGGTTIYELAAIGVPFICFSYAENQEALTSYIGEQKIACFAGAYHKDANLVLERIRDMVSEFCTDKEKRNACYLKEKEMIDGVGAKRLAHILWKGDC